MPALAALTLLAASQGSVTFRTAPPLDRPLEFAVGVEAERADGTPLLSARVVVVQRARAEGRNFRLSRYVSYASAEGDPSMAGLAKEVSALNGRTFPLLLGPDGRSLPFKRKKGENDPSDVPSFAFPMNGAVPVGGEAPVGGVDLFANVRATLRELRELGTVRAAVLTIVPKNIPENVLGGAGSASPAPSGTVVVSPDDGLIFLLDLRAEEPAKGKTPAIRLRLTVRRQNVPGLDRLAAELRMKD